MMNQGQMAQDPSALVPNNLLPHVHLVSSYKFPNFPQLHHAQALEYLIRGPQIVNDTSPVAWTYFQVPPPRGTVLLTWQPPRMQTQYASDGIVWADPEMSYNTELRGYTLQILIHQSGFQYPNEPTTTHSRLRFRIVKGPGMIDPNLWIVHYGTADSGHRMPSSVIQMTPEVHMKMAHRGQLDRAGQLLRKEFMLKDRPNWPKVEFGQQQRPAQPAAFYNPMNQQMGMRVNPPGPPPSKRPRVTPLDRTPQQIRPTIPDPLEDEENAAQDSFDFLTPRQISSMRYRQHHVWMEEIFSSPYGTAQIFPVDLGLGLMGELAPLTSGILDAPAALTAPVGSDAYAVKSYQQLAPEKLADFEKRVADYMAKEEAALEQMKAVHAKKMADLKRSRTYIRAERRLSAVPDLSRSRDGAKDKDVMSPIDPSDGVVHELEKSLGVTFDTKKHVVCVDKGGFIEEQQPPRPPPQQVNGNGATQANSVTGDGALNGLIDEGALDADNSAASLLDQYGSNSMAGTPGASLSVPHISQPQSQAQSAVATPIVTMADSIQGTSFEEQANIDTISGTNDLVDLDVEMSGMTNVEEKGGEGDWVMVNQTMESGQQTGSNDQPTISVGGSAELADQNTLPTSGGDSEPTTGIFDAADFGSFDNLDTAGDALAAYTNADDEMGLDLVDDSAFGDAFHGTETHHGETVDGDNA
ncbi:DUF1750-domain-containing protein [Lindgomyces ingoldianus]|uniref:DUF1750-domain-containing protein n=1 Tax=Lindgomyces ingoldianus TaxID=673940 RepID=A0ACB6RHV3_9PLEO|nr:DUF1750-domain-containing protein [Lindgomyces ingoldianus]KAF2478092.1 DUF1750-domain-containing protein [Lindgomyces ingoldianus]